MNDLVWGSEAFQTSESIFNPFFLSVLLKEHFQVHLLDHPSIHKQHCPNYGTDMDDTKHHRLYYILSCPFSFYLVLSILRAALLQDLTELLCTPFESLNSFWWN